ncbi:MAG: exported protein of unknown function [Methanothrix sp.]|nr:MAG: exported protein of unknown function [Methanothrix sp.]
MRLGKYLMTLAVVCLLATPGMSAPNWGEKGDGSRMMNCGPMDRGMDRGYMVGGFWGGFPLGEDLTAEEMENMTLAELRDMREEKRAEMENMTPAELRELKEQKWAEMENKTMRELRETRRERLDRDRPFLGLNVCLLLTDLTAEDLEGMTEEEIEALREEKTAELDNMTLAEIEALKEDKRGEMENMTLAELREDREVCALMGSGVGRGLCGWGEIGDRSIMERAKVMQGRGDSKDRMKFGSDGRSFKR